MSITQITRILSNIGSFYKMKNAILKKAIGLDLPIENLIHHLPRHRVKKYRLRDRYKIEKIIIHHSATASGSAFAFARYHVEQKDWPGIGYHYVIDGVHIKKCNYLNTVSYHCRGENHHSVGICVVGNFDRTSPTDNDYMLIIKAIRAIDNELILRDPVPVEFHRDHSSKTCPGIHFDGERFYHLLNAFRSDSRLD